jgi:hypothetical protein
VDVYEEGATGKDVGALAAGGAAWGALTPRYRADGSDGRYGGGSGEDAARGGYRRGLGLVAHGQRAGRLMRQDANRDRL